MSNTTIGIVMLVLGIAVLIWSSLADIIIGVGLIVGAVLLLTGKFRVMR